ncbi:hypothetical protein [Nostoc sp. NZL]|nr:hypothetical protein [Nostoc sp. NZL]
MSLQLHGDACGNPCGDRVVEVSLLQMRSQYAISSKVIYGLNTKL